MLKDAPTRKVEPPSARAHARPGREERARVQAPGSASAHTGDVASRPNCRSSSNAGVPQRARSGVTSSRKPGPYAADSDAEPYVA